MQANVSVWPLRFKLWTGEPVTHTYGNKAGLDSDGEAVFAELAILRLLEKDGYEGVWVDTFGHGKLWKSMEDWKSRSECVLPDHAREVYERIVRENDGRKRGCWDVLAWKNGAYLFVESKRKGKDRMRANQFRWLDAALRAGLELSCFRVCEWDIEQ